MWHINDTTLLCHIQANVTAMSDRTSLYSQHYARILRFSSLSPHSRWKVTQKDTTAPPEESVLIHQLYHLIPRCLERIHLEEYR
jgi:hypothetical protein